MLAGVDAAHAMGVAHRDLKPSNVVVTKTGVVKVLDFGIAKLLGDEKGATRTGARLGTLLYMSPEQVRGSKDVDARTDLWSLGVALYEMLAGHVPFDGADDLDTMNAIAHARYVPVSTANPRVPVAFDGVIARALTATAADRFDSCAEFDAALANALRPAMPPPARPFRFESVQTVDPQPPSSGNTLTMAAAAAVAMVALLVGLFVFLKPTPAPAPPPTPAAPESEVATPTIAQAPAPPPTTKPSGGTKTGGNPRADVNQREEDRKKVMKSGLMALLGGDTAGTTSNAFGPGGIAGGLNNALGDANGVGGLGARAGARHGGSEGPVGQ